MCWCHYTRVRNTGTTARTQPKFDHAAQAAVLAELRKGKSLRAAALAAGWNPGSVRQMVREGRRKRPNSSLVDFARQVDGILLTTLPRSPQRFDGLSLDGRLFLEALERQTDRSLQRDPTRWRWRRSGQLPPWGEAPWQAASRGRRGRPPLCHGCRSGRSRRSGATASTCLGLGLVGQVGVVLAPVSDEPA